jgi:arylsulfatase A-like enzyme
MKDRAKARRGAGRASGPRIPRGAWIGAVVLAVAIAGAVLVLRDRGSPRSVDLARILRPGAASGFNVLLVTLDTVRADRLGSYGATAGDTPNLDALLDHGVQFDDAVTPVPITLPSHASMFTGLYPPRHGVRDNGLFRLASEHRTLTEVLKERGYATAAFIGCFVLEERFGLARGFDVYDFEVDKEGFFPSNFDFNQRSAGAVTDAAVRWLGQRENASAETPFFMWVHYFDAHVPYQSPLGKEPRFAGRPYEAEVAYIDREVGRLFAELDRRDLRRRTLIVVVSDHGEGLREHDESTHGLFVYESTLRVPFILSSPGLFRGESRVDDRVVSLVDLRPTLESLLGIPIDTSVDGIDLVGVASDPDRSVYIETMMPLYAARCSPSYGIRRRHEKYVEAPAPEYYDLAADPNEQRNVIASNRERSEVLAGELEAMQERWPGAQGGASARAMSSEEAERLRSLGYVHDAPSSASATDSLPPVRAMISASMKLSDALRLEREGRVEDALRTAREAARECEGSMDAVALVAQLCQKLGRNDEAIEALTKLLEVRPSAGAALQLAQAYLMTGKYEQVESALQTAERLEPDNGFVHMLRGDLYSTRGRFPEAIREYEAALEVDPHRVGMIARPLLERLKAQGGATTGPRGSR